MSNDRKNITVKESTHETFKRLADEHGMKFDPFLKKLIKQSNAYEAIKGL